MKYLAEITLFLTRTNGKNFTNAIRRHSNTQIGSFVNLIKNQPELSDELASKQLFGSAPADPRYMTAKYRYKRFLNKQLLLWHPQKTSLSKPVAVSFYLSRQFAVTQTLFQYGIKHSAEEISKHCLKLSLDYSLSRFSAEFSRFLMMRGMEKASLKETRYYKKIYEEELENYHAEGRLSAFMNDIIARFLESKAPKPETADEIRHFLNAEKSRAPNRPDFKYLLKIEQLNLYKYQLSGTPVLTLRAVDNTMEFFKKYPKLVTNKMRAEVESFRMESCIKLRMDKKAVKAAESAFHLSDRQSQHWIHIADQYMLFLLANKRIGEARELLNSVRKNELKSSKFPEMAFVWNVREAWLELISELSDKSENLKTPPFKLQKFLNSLTSSATHDLSGLKIEIRYLEVLFLIARKDFGSVIGKMDALKTAIYRNLKKPGSRRNLIFGKMLLILTKKGFNPDLTEKLVSKYRQELKATEYTRDLDSGEVIEFGTLWDWTIENLRETKSWKANLTLRLKS